MHIVPRVGTRGSRVIDDTARCGNYIFAWCFFVYVREVYGVRCLLSTLCTLCVHRRVTRNARHLYMYTFIISVCFYGCICAAWLTCFLRIYACSSVVRVRILHAIGIHEKVHELYPATTPLDEEIEIHSVTFACPSLPSWVTSAMKHLQCYYLRCASVETVRISFRYYCDSLVFFKRNNDKSMMKKFQNKLNLVL